MSDFLISGLRSVDLEVPDLEAAERFYTEVWGLRTAETAPGVVWLHGTGDDHHLVALHAAPAPAIRSMTFRATSAEALDRLASHAATVEGRLVAPAAPADDPAGGAIIALDDLWGRRVRVVHDDQRRAPDPPTGDQPERLAHVNFNSPDVDAEARFFEEALGFKLTDRSKLMAFVRTNADHHSIVIADAPVATLNHVAFLQPSWESVMRAAGRLVDAGFPIAWGVGRHGPGDNVFAYFIDPFGIVVEHTAEVLQVDDDYRVRGPSEWTWPPGRTDHWGIAPPKSDACKKAQLAIPFVGPGR